MNNQNQNTRYNLLEIIILVQNTVRIVLACCITHTRIKGYIKGSLNIWNRCRTFEKLIVRATNTCPAYRVQQVRQP